MLPSMVVRSLRSMRLPRGSFNRSRIIIRAMGIVILLILVGLEFVPFLSPRADAQSHTSPTLDENCQQVNFSSDGNPFPICPGPFPATGGNCVWWAWEQWHLLGYDLPLNWGNAADWIVDAERAGLPMGTTPRLGAIAVFPRADGVWAYGTPGHVAFVTSVSNGGMSFNVTYQNYGDPTPMYVGTNYNTSIINQPQFQNGELRFIYFPQSIDPVRFMQLPGIGSASLADVVQANHLFASVTASSENTQVTLGISSAADEQEFNADFTGDGHSDLLLYNRSQGQLDILSLGSTPSAGVTTNSAKKTGANTASNSTQSTHMVSLHDSITSAGKWGSSLEIHVGDFNGSGHPQILLYDRSLGTIQILSLTPQLTIKKHVILPGWGPDWELYVGRFDGQRSGLFMYKRFAVAATTSPVTITSSTSGSTSKPTPTRPTTQPTKTTTPDPTPTATTKPSPTTTPKPTATATPKPSPTVTPSPTPSPSPTRTPTPSPTATKTATPTPSPTPSPSPTATKTATPTPSPTPSPSPTATKTATPTPSPTATATKTATPTPSPTATKSVTPSPTATKVTTPTATATKTATPSATATVKTTQNDFAEPSPTPAKTVSDLSGSAPTNWEQQGRSANILLVDFDGSFRVHVQQSNTLWHANWEVYVGHFVSPTQDGIFLYDRLAGEGRLMDFDSSLKINDYREMHNLDGNWMVSIGDFIGSGQAQLFLYDPQSGDGQMLAFNHHLQLVNQRIYPKLGANEVLYVGHFGMSSLNIMLYNPQAARSTFIAFKKTLELGQHVTVKSWSARWQILIGAFLSPTNLSQCQKSCVPGDDILVLDRQTGQMGEYAFSFGRKFQVYDNRVQSFNRLGVDIDSRLNSVDTTTFSLLNTLKTTIKNEELY